MRKCGPRWSPVLPDQANPPHWPSLLRALAQRHPATLVIPHFVGASPDSTGLRKMLFRFCSVLKSEFGFDDDVPPDTNSLVNTFRQFLTQVPEDHRVLLVIDALNQLDDAETGPAAVLAPLAVPCAASRWSPVALTTRDVKSPCSRHSRIVSRIELTCLR